MKIGLTFISQWESRHIYKIETRCFYRNKLQHTKKQLHQILLVSFYSNSSLGSTVAGTNFEIPVVVLCWGGEKAFPDTELVHMQSREGFKNNAGFSW